MFQEIVKGYNTITFIGICKNAGKTTTMTKVLEELSCDVVGITSIGRDGESTDLVTSTKKPEIYVKKGTIFATAKGMLALCDVTIEVLFVTDFFTPFGEVVIFKALSDGYIQIAGPPTVLRIKEVSEKILEFGASRVLVDGAASRKSLADSKPDSCAIFCVGASMDKSMQKTINETCHIIEMFQSERLSLDFPLDKYVFLDENFQILLKNSQEIDYKNIDKNTKYLYIDGAVTTKIVTDIYKKGFKFGVITKDATHFLCDRSSKEQFFMRGGKFFVTNTINVVAVTANPFSAYGAHYDKNEFLSELRERINLPVLDVMEEV